MKRRAKSRPVVARRRLDKDVGEAGALANLAIRHAVHRASACEAQRVRAGRLADVPEHMDRGVFEHGLQGRRDRLMRVVERFVGPARGSEQGLELRREHAPNRGRAIIPGHLDAVGPMAEIRQVQREASLVAEVYQRLERLDEPWLSVGSESHYLELIAIIREPKVLGDGEIQKAEGVWKEFSRVHVQRGAFNPSPRRADKIAEAVDGADGGPIERADECGAGQVRRMMLDEARARPDDRDVEIDALGKRGGQRVDPDRIARAIADRSARAPAEQEHGFAPEVRAGIA
jgi:hypothetical protein